MWVDFDENNKPSLVKITANWIQSWLTRPGYPCVICGNVTQNSLYNELSELDEYACGPGEGLDCYLVLKQRGQKWDSDIGERDFYSNYNTYIKSHEWETKAVAAKRLAGWECQKCHKSGTKKTLDAHHLHYKTLYRERPKDIEVLCRTCHSKQHGKR